MLIEKFSLGEKVQGNAYQELVDFFVGELDVLDIALLRLERIENEYMESVGTALEKTKKGKWKRTKLLPGSYLSAKSQIATAIKLGINIEGKTRGELQQEINAAKRGKTNFEDKVINMARGLSSALNKARQMGTPLNDLDECYGSLQRFIKENEDVS